MLVCDWCHKTSDVLRGVRFEMTPIKHEREAILISYDLCGSCQRDAAEAIRQVLSTLIEKKKAERSSIPEN